MICSRCKKRMAVVFIASADAQTPRNEGLCLVCAKELNIKPVNDMIARMGISEEDLENLSEQFNSFMPSDDNEDDSFEVGGAQSIPFLQSIFGNFGDGSTAQKSSADKDQKEKSKKDKKKDNQAKRKYLSQYCTDLTQKARDGQLDRIIGRDKEIYRVVQILSRRTKNNPCLIGEPGVGKTAIAEGLAQRIVEKNVPFRLQKKEVHLLDLTALVAGTQFRGQFESRIKGLVDEVKNDGNVILFIDEVHNLVGTGDAEGSMNAANILKPALSRGEIQVIGATTFNEYRKYIEKDSALERRFQPVTIEEPSIDSTISILKGIKEYYENYHRVRVSDGILHKAVVMSERYINDRFLPDKAIDLLDEACSSAALRNVKAAEYDSIMAEMDELKQQEEEYQENPESLDYEEIARIRSEIIRLSAKADELRDEALGNQVTDDDLAKVIELWTGIPAAKVKEAEIQRLAKFEERLKEYIIGQDDAVALIAAAIRRNRVHISTRRRPASFIFVGPTGVGKTELVKVLARELFDMPDALIRLDMSEFMEKHAVSRIIGSPPGYVGYDEAGQLTEKVRRRPYSVVLFDEIEKAHPDVMNILLQILDEGKIMDAQGRTVNFQNTVIVMTSNAGSALKDGFMGFGKTVSEASKDKVMKALSDFLRPEFISRVDEVVVFTPLMLQDFEKIAELMLNELKAALKDKGIELKWNDDVLKTLAKESFGGKYGARDLRNDIRRKVEDKIASLLIDRAGESISRITISGGEALDLKVK